jgi:AmmeMemoRadiSam system protein A
MAEQTSPIVELARAAVDNYVSFGKIIVPTELTEGLKEKAGVFVSIKKQGQLRGCIGTFEPTKPSIAEEIVSNAISSATSDPRFDPIRVSELDDLQPVQSRDELDPELYGVIVESGFKRGLLLPALEGVTSAEEQIQICKMKAGISDDEPVKLYRFLVRRYK